jgi:hypothetical protein
MNLILRLSLTLSSLVSSTSEAIRSDARFKTASVGGFGSSLYRGGFSHFLLNKTLPFSSRACVHPPLARNALIKGALAASESTAKHA